ncbi:hypothetical protein N7513_011502 [Penicillium frequentans]|nr:hypothetical protein N7513_011502 [Penicillium glabrum]
MKGGHLFQLQQPEIPSIYSIYTDGLDKTLQVLTTSPPSSISGYIARPSVRDRDSSSPGLHTHQACLLAFNVYTSKPKQCVEASRHYTHPTGGKTSNSPHNERSGHFKSYACHHLIHDSPDVEVHLLGSKYMASPRIHEKTPMRRAQAVELPQVQSQKRHTADMGGHAHSSMRSGKNC